MSLIHTIEEQLVIGFIGKINVLQEGTSQHVGVIHINDGLIVNGSYKDLVGEKALVAMLVNDVTSRENYKFIVEPEIIGDGDIHLSLTLDQVKQKARVAVESYKASKNLRPPGHLKLLINSDFLIQGEDIGLSEYKILCAISDNSKVDDIYASVDLYEHEITEGLISLRKKKALRVIGG